MSDMTKKLEMLVASAEWVIVYYLKEHNDCVEPELLSHVRDHLSIKANKKGEIIRKPESIHTLAFLIAFKELEAEGILKIDRGNVLFPMIDGKTRFSLAKP